MNIAEMLRVTVERYPAKIAVTYAGESISWRLLYDRALCLREELLANGLARGRVVAIYADHSPAQIIAMFGAAMAEASFTIINPLLKLHQVEHQFFDCDAGALVGTARWTKNLLQDCKDRDVPLITVKENGELQKEHAAAALQDVYPLRRLSESVPTDVACIIYTSGSTGLPKGVVVPHRTLLDGARIVSGYLGITAEDVLLGMLPYNFDYGLNQVMCCVRTGARLVVYSYRVPNDLIAVVEREKVTGMAAVPSLWPQILNPRLASQEGGGNLTLRYITTAGGIHPTDMLKKLCARFPNTEIIVMYGLTESFRSTYLPFSEIHRRPGSIGRPVPEVDIMVINENGDPCPIGEKGELVHRGAFVSYGYLNDSDLTEAKFMRLSTGGDGCLPEYAVKSGDIVSMDEDGYIYFHGRADTQMKCAGYRVSPTEIEEVALSVPNVNQAAAFGLDDADLGQSVNLAYSTFNGQPIEDDLFRAHMIEAVPSYARPREIVFYASLPLTVNGKVDYQRIKQEIGENVK